MSSPCAASDCSNEATHLCSGCKKTKYCGADCQTKDWPAHKKLCAPKPKKNNSNNNTGTSRTISISPFGHMFNHLDGTDAPMSTLGKYFDPMFGYTAETFQDVYTDLVSAYRLLKLGEHGTAARLPESARDMEFSEWMDRVERAGNVLPQWWTAEVHRVGVEEYARVNLERTLSRSEIQAGLKLPMRIMALEMMIEGVMHDELKRE
ncbi:hypothetical protein FB45DRAFT_928111 [Roridomyces roridus]|uniref:MYND-type domain-containing protein n=1 Tax=Roridomyces roridus TaxID=1738132 RepID=A0AAD7BHH9_9AGAR|nr:hypothetical protein FB45DRAFT_928111 [Roridomyces roridus]